MLQLPNNLLLPSESLVGNGSPQWLHSALSQMDSSQFTCGFTRNSFTQQQLRGGPLDAKLDSHAAVTNYQKAGKAGILHMDTEFITRIPLGILECPEARN